MDYRELAEKLLAHLEFILDDEWSSDGDDTTGFARGFLGMPLPDNKFEHPHRLTDEWQKGMEARKAMEDDV